MALLTTVKPRNIDITGDYVVNSISASGNVSANNIKSDHLLYANGSPYVFTTNAAGTNTQVQFNDGNSFAGSANLTFDKTSGTLTVAYLSGDGSNVANVNAKSLNGHSDTYFASTTYVDNAVANLVNSAPSALDTLNELANALGNDASFSTSITNSLANKLSVSAFNSTANTWIATQTTSNLSEGTNQYFTEARANTAIDNRVTKTFVDNLAVVANIANVAYSVSGANVSGQVGYAAVANSVAGANVSGFVSNANVSNTAYSVSGANVSGEVSYSATANSVAVANVSGIGNIATINLDGNASNILYGNGSFAGAPVTYSDSNVAAYLPNYTGNLNGSNLTITGKTNLGNVGNLTITGGSNGYLLTTDGNGNLAWSNTSTTSVGDLSLNQFTANGVQTSFSLSSTPSAKKYVTVHMDGVYITSNSYSLSGNSVVFQDAPYVDTVLEISVLSPGVVSSASTVTNAAQSNITSVGTLTGLTVSGTTNLGAVANVHITGGSNGQALLTDGAGNLSFGSAGVPSGKIVALNMFLGF